MIDQTDAHNLANFSSVVNEDFDRIFTPAMALTPNLRLEVQVLPINQLGGHTSPAYVFQGKCEVNRFAPPAEFNAFLEKVKKQIQDLLSVEQTDQAQTALYEPLCQQLKALVKNRSTGTYTQLLLYTDMLEHSSLISMYQNIDNWDALYQEFSTKYRMELPKDLSGVNIWIINFRNEQSEPYIRSANRFWEYILEKRGATVIFERPHNQITTK